MRLIALLLMLLFALPAAAEDRPIAGLMWNRSGLPATLPLQLRSQPGLDHLLILTPPDENRPVLQAYIRGGAFFRVLVPPGKWRVQIASGRDWQGDQALFGANTQHISLPDPLTFGVADGSRLKGHVLWLGQDGDQVAVTAVAPQTICRLANWTSETRDLRDDRPTGTRHLSEDRPQVRPLPRDEPRSSQVQRPPLSYIHSEMRLRSIFCD